MLANVLPLHDACREGNIALVRELLAQGCLVNQSNFDLVQPLHEASFGGHVDCVLALLENGANVNGRNIDGATPLCDACSRGSEDCVKILLAHGASVNPPLLLSSPLHEAVLRDKWRCSQLLVDAGANLNHTDCHYGTPLHAAVHKGSINCASVLLKSGCCVDAVKVLNTPLHYAARLQDYGMVALLLEFGADPTVTDNDGHSALDLLPSSTCKVRPLLQHWMSHPRSLKHLCQSLIRSCVGPSHLHHIHNLHLPKLLHDYLTFEYI